MASLLQKLLIRQRIWVLVTLCLIGLIAIASIAVNKAQNQFLTLKESEYTKLTHTAIQTLDFFYKLSQSGQLTEIEAKKLAKLAIKNLALGERNYYYMYNASNDFLIMHPAVDATQSDDTPALIKEAKLFDRNAKQELGERLGLDEPTYSTLAILKEKYPQTLNGFIEYYLFYTPNDHLPVARRISESNIPDIAEHKMAYGSYFEPWDWAILTGVYRKDERESFYDWVKNMVLVSGAIIFVILIFAWLIANSIAKPLLAIVELMTDISHGTGDLTKRLREEGNNELAQFSHAFNVFVDKIAGLVRRVSETNGEVIEHSQNMAGVMNKSVSRSDEQLSETEMLASSTNELSASFNDVATRIQKSSTAACSAEEASNHAKSSMSKSIDSINSLTQALSNAQSDVKNMETFSNRVASVLDVIVGIAEQTNLLALNAAIEAARAGEQGRGFAVVADEVRTLAQRTQNSTTEIRDIIDNLQGGTKQVVRAMEEGLKNSEICIQTVADANTIFQSVNNHVGTIAQNNLEIVAAVNQQSQMTNEIAASSQKIADTSKQNLSASELNKQSSHSLNQLLSEMGSLVEQFKV